MDTDYKHTHKFYMKYCLRVNGYKNGNSAKLQGYV